ncbi:uncharacterized mitochondrial protein AtMg00810-like [Phaseolus vulgaris]|uniref:uncharacterized mitochondrial protein AtMg00810-like n=1 Tax=Phaseolus vulgaris TaxID=3885 RepID=UPI0035CAB850
MITRGKSGIFKPQVFSSTVDIEVVPSTVKEVLKLPNWVVAMKEEYHALLANHTWTLTQPLQDIQPIGCKWSLISSLQQHFGLKDLGRLHYFLGIEISWTTHGSLHLSQTKYITDLLHKSGMLSSKPQPTPMISSMRLTRDGTTTVDDSSLYRSVVGSLQYILITRPELSYSVNKVCQYLHNPQLHHWKAVKRILRYLVGTQSHGLLLQPSPHLTIVAFADAGWGSDPDDRKSISGYTVFFGSNPVVWSSNKKKTVSRSTTEAEYRSIAAALAEIKWVSNLLQELSISFPTPKIYSDNLGAVLLTANPIMHFKTKHFDLDLHFVCDSLQQHQLQLSHVPSHLQLADILTKPLTGSSFHKFMAKLMVVSNPTISLQGDVT